MGSLFLYVKIIFKLKSNLPSPVQHIKDNLFIKREDLIHPLVSGNKYRKLKYNIQYAINNGFSKIISFGGAYSNHIHALAFACMETNIDLELFIRGDEVSNPTISEVLEHGATIRWMDRRQYRSRNDTEFIQRLKDANPNAFLIPEGGTNALALIGLKEMMEELYIDFPDRGVDVVVAYGSGGTSIGMMQVLRKIDQLHIVPVLDFPDFEREINASAKRMNVSLKHFQSHINYHFGGYAKFTPELIQFIHDFHRSYGIPLDPIYTGKVAYATMDLIQKGIIGNSNSVVMIHSGGLQGIRGFNERFGMTLKDH